MKTRRRETEGNDVSRVRELCEKLRERLAENGMPTFGEDLAQGNEHKAPPMKARMRQNEVNPFGFDREDLILIEQQVEINRARAFRNGALATDPALDLLARAEKLHRIERCAQEDDLIEEARSGRAFHRLRLVDGRAALHRPTARKLLTRARKMRGSIAKI
jgi:hypothetical protein